MGGTAKRHLTTVSKATETGKKQIQHRNSFTSLGTNKKQMAPNVNEMRRNTITSGASNKTPVKKTNSSNDGFD